MSAQTTIRLPDKLGRWVHREAKKRHSTVTDIIIQALQREKDGFLADVYALAAMRLAAMTVVLQENGKHDHDKVKIYERETIEWAAAEITKD